MDKWRIILSNDDNTKGGDIEVEGDTADEARAAALAHPDALEGGLTTVVDVFRREPDGGK